MTTKLIQKLVGLCVEKGARFEYDNEGEFITVSRSYNFRTNFIFLSDKEAPQQLQAAIDKIKGL